MHDCFPPVAIHFLGIHNYRRADRKNNHNQTDHKKISLFAGRLNCIQGTVESCIFAGEKKRSKSSFFIETSFTFVWRYFKVLSCDLTPYHFYYLSKTEIEDIFNKEVNCHPCSAKPNIDNTNLRHETYKFFSFFKLSKNT